MPRRRKKLGDAGAQAHRQARQEIDHGEDEPDGHERPEDQRRDVLAQVELLADHGTAIETDEGEKPTPDHMCTPASLSGR